MAAWCVFRDAWVMITSHDPVHLVLASAIKQIKGENMNVDISSYEFRDVTVTTPLIE